VLGLRVEGDSAMAGGIRLRFGAEGEGIAAWRVRGLPDGDLDGLRTHASTAPPRGAGGEGPVVALDHLVASTPDFERTVGALRAAGLEPRRIREAGPELRQAFYVMGGALLELAGPREPTGDEPARFWGLVLVVDDLDAAVERLGELAGAPRDAVQPGRRIATVRPEAGLGTAVALMTPR
jgi:hypothetical protein